MVRGTFSGFTTALRGLGASQRWLDVTGNNLTNVNTKGYTRQRVDLYSAVSCGSTDRYSSLNANRIGQGVVVGGISQVRDPFLDVRFRREANKLGEIDERISTLKDLANIFDETMNDGLKDRVTDVIKQLNSLSNETGSAEFDGIVKASMELMTKMFNQYAIQTGEIRTHQDEQLGTVDIPAVNDLMKNIAALNKSIKDENSHGNPALELMDQRNQYIDELSSYMNISITETPITLPNGLVVNDMSIQLVNGENMPLTDLITNEKFAQLSYGKDGDGKTVISISPASGNVSFEETGSALDSMLKGIADLNNSILGLGNPPNSAKLASLTNDREKLIKSLTNLIPGIEVTDGVGANGTTYKEISVGGKDLVNLGGAANVTVNGNTVLADGADITSSIEGKVINDKFANGILKGALDMLNSSGEFDTPPNSSRGIGYYEKILDSIASKMADEFNTMNSLHDPATASINPNFDPSQPESATNLKYTADPTWAGNNPGWASGVVSPENPTGSLYPPGNEWKPLFGDRDGNYPITAKGMTLAKGWVDTKYGITSTKNPQGPDGSVNQSENILAMIKLFDKDFQFTVGDDPNGTKLFLGSFQGVLSQTTTVLDLDLSSSTKLFNNHITVLNGVDEQRLGLSSVNMDEEGINMLRYQKSYNAAARLMTTMDEAIATIINNMGRVGL